MNRCAYQQNALAASAEMRGDSISVPGGVVCPKPRRLSLLNPSRNDHIRPSRCLINYQPEVCDSNAGKELLDMILTKGSYGVQRSNSQIASSPPFFCGSPPSRASNPVVQDAQFGNGEASPFLPVQEGSPSSAARKNGGCARLKLGHKPAAVRIEGFNCRGISAFA